MSWVQIKQTELKSKASTGIDISPLHADSTFILHLLVRQYDRCSNIPTSSTGNPPWQLKSNLPQFSHITRCFRSVSVTPLNCCTVAKCLYVSLSSRPAAQTGRERMSRFRKVNLEYREREQLQDMSAHKRARKDVTVRSREQPRDTSARKQARSDVSVRAREQTRNTSARKGARSDVSVRAREQTRNTSARKRARSVADVRTAEQSRDTHTRRESRKNEDVRNHENLLKSVQRNPGRGCISVDELKTHFHSVVSQGPVYVCSSCDQLFYQH